MFSIIHIKYIESIFLKNNFLDKDVHIYNFILNLDRFTQNIYF